MTISYNWLNDYLPEKLDPEKLSKILTSVGLEVEFMENYESIKGGLEGLVVGEVLTCEDHTNSDHLHVTTVSVGESEPLQIVCGAPNVAAGQKVIVATVGTTIYPKEGEPLTMKKAKIRGVESFGMICAADEIGVGESHDGILVLPAETKPGTKVSEIFKVYKDILFEIGLTPNHMDAMSHIGTARDVSAYLSRHQSKDIRIHTTSLNSFSVDNHDLNIGIEIENKEDCQRYTGLCLTNIKVGPSPDWIQDRLRAVGVRPINNVVDITNFVLQEYGQPLHAFDADKISGGKIIVKNLPEGTKFLTLDEKERTLKSTDLMICDEKGGLCIAGVFGGIDSGISETTTKVFLESAWFKPTTIRKTSMSHGLRTDAAQRFEKGADISITVTALKRAALLLKEYAGATISSDIQDVYPKPKEETHICLKYHYLKKLSGKNYHPDTIKRILSALGFGTVKEGMDEIWISVPFSKPDITLPADIVEEILRIDGLDNVEIPASMHITPAVDHLQSKLDIQEKIANYLVGVGFNEIITNPITNSAYYSEEVLQHSVKMLNSLTAELNIMRPSMLETGLEVISYNVKRKQTNLQLFEYGKNYSTKAVGEYKELERLALYITGKTKEDDWISKGKDFDFFHAKGIVNAIVALNGFNKINYKKEDENTLSFEVEKSKIGFVTKVSKEKLNRFDLKTPVFYIEIDILNIVNLVVSKKIVYKEVSKFPVVSRDLAMVVDKQVSYDQIDSVIKKSNLNKLEAVRLFDIFENEKLGNNKKSIAVNFSFQDAEKTLTDKEIDAMVQKLISGFEKEISAEIRK
ncbi:MAG: phenylalanine--tRNA ligase subunit beta [Pseudopedobacter saltans]|uniref:Phenylalanine--tRNA ligase beta subunit n=1 Tax=Pseudopedobacter saltans TaxID=151895 RepID=A0A2W5GWE8_9SPHI|nr:MAG: phenylalanine--tRNA ligase subunit beta [Pseudopedobacter saltans]